MKIEKLIIYGFGKHENVTIDLGANMNVLYGENEAGKTTIQQFILHILFGFPQRNSTMLRYEPKSDGKYGGQLQLVDEVYGRCTVERVRGKSAGDVTVYFEDGKRGGEEALQQLLRQYDRASFEAIFSFSLLQLQGFEKMDEGELSRTLLASGTTGVDSLLKLETKMAKEMDELFKKSGRNPLLNVKIKEIRTLESELQEAGQQIAEYAPAIERIHQIDSELTKLNEERNHYEERRRQLSLQRQLLPIQYKKDMLLERLEELGTTDFPTDGIRRFESLTGKMMEAETAVQRMEHELANLEKKSAAEFEANRMTELEFLLAREFEWHQWRSSLATWNAELQRLGEQQERLWEHLGIQREEAHTLLIGADVSRQKEEEMYTLLAELTRINHDIGFVESQFIAVKDDLEQVEQKRHFLAQPSEEEMKTTIEWPMIRQRLAEAKAFIAYGGKQSNRFGTYPLAMILAAFVLFGFGMMQQQWMMIGVGILLAGAGSFFYWKKEPSSHSKLEEMEKFVAYYEGREEEMERLILRVDAYTREDERLTAEIEELRRKEVQLDTKLEQLDVESQQIASNVERFIGQYGFDELPSQNIIPELFRMIRDVQKVTKSRTELKRRVKEVEREISGRMEAAEKVLQQAVPQEVVYELLRRAFIELGEAAEKKKTVEERIAQLKPVLNETTMLAQSLKEQVETLLDEAGVASEGAFYQAFDIQQEKLLLREQLNDLQLQLAMNKGTDPLNDRTDAELANEMMALEEQRLKKEEENEQLMQEKATLVNKAKQLLTDETYSEQLQIFEMKKAELNELAKKWSARKAIAAAIQQMMHQLKEKQLPDVLSHAEKTFKQLTGGKYERLTMTEQGYFEVVATTGTRFPIIELSQATKEQAYISLRFALATSVLKTAPFPIIMDDPFVHFDAARLSSMIKVLGESTQHQFIYFTCDERMKDKWLDATMINVSTIGNE